MMLQNLALMTEALALGGYPNFANHEFAWFQSLGFRMHTMDASRYLGTRWLERLGMKLLGKDFEVEFPLGLEANDKTLLKPYCPPYHESMEDAVRAVAELKFGEKGAFRCNEKPSAWTDSRSVMNGITEVSERAIETTIAYCNYVFETYGRFPATKPPYTTVMGFQACRLDTDFYEKFYKKEALGQNHWDRGNPGKD